jgi:Zn-dependent protease
MNSPRMSDKPEGSFRLFRFSGITVYLHWIWLLVAYYQIVVRKNEYSTLSWNIAEYVALFGIVLLHEFGHAFASRQVGGSADTILLWPLGGVAYVNTPPRPGAEFWSIAAGPLVNLVLAIPLTLLVVANDISILGRNATDLDMFIGNLCLINGLLLVFNLLPIYPLDGGQILRSLLWFVVGPVRSLYAASIVGFIGVAGLAAYALYVQSIWMGVIAFYVFDGCRKGFMRARDAKARGVI